MQRIHYKIARKGERAFGKKVVMKPLVHDPRGNPSTSVPML